MGVLGIGPFKAARSLSAPRQIGEFVGFSSTMLALAYKLIGTIA